MNYNDMFQQVAQQPDEWLLFPLNAHWWIVLPTEIIKGKQEPIEYLPSTIRPHLDKFTGDVDLYPLLDDIYTTDSEKHPIDLSCVMLLNGKQDSYCLFGSIVTLYQEGKISQFLVK